MRASRRLDEGEADINNATRMRGDIAVASHMLHTIMTAMNKKLRVFARWPVVELAGIDGQVEVAKVHILANKGASIGSD